MSKLRRVIALLVAMFVISSNVALASNNLEEDKKIYISEYDMYKEVIQLSDKQLLEQGG